jgi:hypothetical protein
VFHLYVIYNLQIRVFQLKAVITPRTVCLNIAFLDQYLTN